LFPAFYWVVIAKILSFSKTKIVYTEHSTSNRRIRNPLFKLFDKVIYSRINKVITISAKVDQAIKKYLKSSQAKFCLIPNGVNLAQIQQSLPLPKGEITGVANYQRVIVIQVSSFQHPKDHLTVVNALELLPEGVLSVFVGGGPGRAKVEQYVQQKNLADRVFFLGVRTDVPRLLKTADIVVLSSHYEGFSLASVEGMASEKPLIVSDVPSLNEVVKGAGLLFEDQNHHQLAHHITELMANKDYYNQVAAKCQERARRYDIQTMVNKQVELYKELCPSNTEA